MYEFNFQTELRTDCTALVECTFDYAGSTLIHLRNYDVNIISVTLFSSKRGEPEPPITTDEKELLWNKAYDELEIIKSNEDYF